MYAIRSYYVDALNKYFSKNLSLSGKKVLITAGPTHEAIDPVRFIGNHSSGKMGFALADEIANRGANVTLITGPVNINCNNSAVNRINTISAEQMFNECIKHSDYDIAIMSAAVADYTPETIARNNFV